MTTHEPAFRPFEGVSAGRTVSIGYEREDGDFRILATLSNIDEEMPTSDFETLVDNTHRQLAALLSDIPIKTLERQDTPDYVTLDEIESQGEAA